MTTLDFTKETAVASTVHEPFGKPSGPGLWHVKGMQLPAYIQHVAHDLLDNGHAKSVGEAIQMAVGIVKKWAGGVPVGGERKVGGKGHKHPGHIHPDVQAAAAKAIAEWEAKRARAHAQHAGRKLVHDHSGGTFVGEVDLARRPRGTPADRSSERIRFDAWGNRVDLAMYVGDEEAGEPVNQYEVENAEARLGPDHPHTKKLRARLQKQDAAKGALRDKYAKHMTEAHKRGDHKSMSLDHMQAEHARDHRQHPNMRHGHSDGMSPVGIRVRPDYAVASDVSMSNELAPRYDAWGKPIDLARTPHVPMAPHVPHMKNPGVPSHTGAAAAPHAEHTPRSHRPATPAAVKPPKSPKPTTKSALVSHLRNAHGISGNHEHRDVKALQGLHKRDHTSKPNLTHRHAPGMNPFRSVALSNEVELAKGADPVLSMDAEAVKKAWGKMKKLPPGLRAHMQKRLLVRAEQLKITLPGADTKAANLATPAADSTKKGQHLGFEKLVKRLVAQGKTEEEARAIAAQIGRNKYGDKFQKMSTQGKRGG